MGYRIRQVAAVVSSLTLMSWWGSPAADQPQDPLPEVQLKVNPTSCPLNDSLQVEVRLVNAGIEPMVVHGDLSNGMILQAAGPDGVVLIPKGMTHYHELCVPPPPRPSDFVHLSGGHYLGRSYKVPVRTLGIQSPGTYSLVASYWIRVWGEDSDPHMSLMQDPIRSSSVQITVIAKEK